jgi:hypothetical protein
MVGSIAVIGKKIFSIALVFNSLMSIACVIELLSGFYRVFPYWQPFSPYLADGNILWLAILTAFVNIYPSASIGRALKTGRLLFHHYVYGFLVLILAVLFVVLFTSTSLTNLFIVNTSDIAVNVGRFFLLGGLALFLDDLPDVSKRIESTLNSLKAIVYRGRKIIYCLQFLTGLGSFYIFFAISFWVISNPPANNAGHFILLGTLLITSLTSFGFVIKKAWLNITLKK